MNVKNSLWEQGTAKIGVLEVRVTEVRPRKIRTEKTCPLEMTFVKVHPSKVGVRQIKRLAFCFMGTITSAENDQDRFDIGPR